LPRRDEAAHQDAPRERLDPLSCASAHRLAACAATVR
jgi:hypothetical protein